MIDLIDGTNTQYELNYKKQTVCKQLVAGKLSSLGKMDYDKKTTVVDYNPKKNIFVVGSMNSFFFYSG
jgi:hypothetical protein